MDDRQRWVLALTSVAALMVMLDMLVVTTALDAIRRTLGASITGLEWTVNAFTLAFAVFLMTASALGDRLGRRKMLVAGLAVFTLASAACAVAPGTGALIAARAAQGLGAAMVMPLAFSLLSAAFPPERRAKALGLFSGVTGLATLGGPLLGGAIVQGLSWQWIFWLNVPLGLVVIPLVRARIPESTGPAAPLDLPGVTLVTGAAFGVVWALVHGNGYGWTRLDVLGPLAVGLALGAGFVWWERRSPAPMLPMRLFRSRAFSAGNATGFLLYASIFGTAFFLPQFLQIALHYGPLRAGLALVPWTMTLTLVAPVAGTRIARFGERPLLAGGLFLQAVGFAWIALIAGPSLPYALLVPPLVLAGTGVSMAMPAAQHAVINSVGPAELGKASGAFNTLRQLGGTFGVVIVATVFTAAGGYGSPATFTAGFGPAVGTAAVLSLTAAVAGLWLPGRRVNSEPAEPVLEVSR
ncbi:MFS transporter [Amycolatopsis alkalitolerans]|uniref:MFS transporter n=1 Tax=Amycolatopsis alkalitolerans TaxID=2547244 RepID=A0A5C4LWZ9_9PSEU|nr:MFS transporter [Amycolatopsis alkalitolerans]TNC22594.1 MFS transporter [Amycolatopsis alkalitolerans]